MRRPSSALSRCSALILLRVPVGMAMGLVGVTGYGADRRRRAGAQDGRTDLDADGHRLHIRRHSDVPLDGRVRLRVRHEPRTVPGRQFFRWPLAGRPRPRHDRRLRRLCRYQRFVGRDRGDLRHRRLPGDAAIRIPAILRSWGDRRRRNARRDLSALDGAGRLRPHHPAGHRQAVHRRDPSGPPRGLNVHADDRRHRRRSAGLSAGGPTQQLERAAASRCATFGPPWRCSHS